MSSQRNIRKVSLLMAMQEEADPIINSLQLMESKRTFFEKLPFRSFEKQIGELQISLITSGIDQRNQVDNIGCEAATLMANECITRLNPEVMISAGTAGGFANQRAKIGTIYASKDHFVFHDRIVPLPGFRESGVGKFPAAKIDKMVSDLGFESGIISTGSSLEKNEKDTLVMEQNQVVAKEMEAAAIAWVAMLYDVPMFAIKSITNLVDLDNSSEREFLKNFNFSVSELSKALEKVIGYLSGRSLSELTKLIESEE